jgi:hypothetical protein
MSNRLYMTNEELALWLEEKCGVQVRLWDIDQSGVFLGFAYDGPLIKLRSSEECGNCGGTGEICFSSTSYGPCPSCSALKSTSMGM